MAPKSKSESTPKAPESTASRRSARIAGSAAPPSEVKEEGKKRGASAPKSDQKAKKTKTESKSTKKSAPIAEEDEQDSKEDESKDSKEDSKEGEEEEKKKAKEEKKAEAPKSAKSDTGSSKALKVGDSLPSLILQDENGKDVEVNKLTEGGKGVVIFLYPKADTPGCTTQACGFRDHHDEIKELGYDIYGLSKDKPTAQQKWIAKKSLNYTLLSDPESKFIKKLGAFVQPNNTKRSHFIFSKDDGKLIDAALGVKPADDPSNVIKFIKNHHK